MGKPRLHAIVKLPIERDAKQAALHYSALTPAQLAWSRGPRARAARFAGLELRYWR